jgi:tetratricopeptide (TPR) repeat protein
MRNFCRQILFITLIFTHSACFGDVEQSGRPIDGMAPLPSGEEFVAVVDVFDQNCDFFINSGIDAHRVGFFSLAKKFFTKVLGFDNLSDEQKCTAFTWLIEACLAAGDFSEVMDKFDAILELTNVELGPTMRDRFLLRVAILACFKHDFATANKILLKLEARVLDDNDLAWHFATRSALFAASMNFEKMESNMEEAKKYSTSTDQIAQIQAFSVQFLLRLAVKPSELNSLTVAIDSLCKKYKWQKNGYPFVRAHALLLIRASNNQKARDLLDEQISNVPASDVQNLQSFHLLRALADGLHSSNGYHAISNLLLSATNDELKKQALKLLISSAENAKQRMDALRVLSDKRFQALPKGMVRQILFAKIRLAIDAESIATAQQIAEEIALQFPKETFMRNVYQALAYLAWQSDPKDFRMAAHYLGKMRDLAQNDTDRMGLTAQIGNAFYLSGAYDIASHAYEEVLKSNVVGIQYDKILCQLIQADIQAGNLAAAEQHLQSFKQNHNMLTEYRWRAELLFINALIGGGNPEKAMEYSSVFTDSYASQIQPFYLIKFYLLQAHSTFSKQNYQRAHVLAANICEIFPSRSNAAEIARIVAQALFIKGACECQLKNDREGFRTFERLRTDYPEQEVAMLSYFEEAEFLRKNENVPAACELLTKCAESNCPYSPFAYYRCAECYKSMGMQYHDRAISNLATLISKYGNHEIVYAAHLKIADILRMDGRFSDAQLAYEELLKAFPFDRRYHFTEFCLAKSIFAQKSKGGTFTERTLMILERLYATAATDNSLHIEIAAMYCLVLHENFSIEAMKKIGWEVLLASVAEEKELTPNDVYWLLQIANLLTDCYESESDGTEIEALQQITDKLKTIFGEN